MREKTDTLIQMSNGNFTTRINKVKRNSQEGFELRRGLKLTRKPKHITAYRFPQFFNI